MFEAMAGNFTSSRDIHLFLNVLNGALMLHSEDSLILRYVIATYVNAAFNFKNIFSTNGYVNMPYQPTGHDNQYMIIYTFAINLLSLNNF